MKTLLIYLAVDAIATVAVLAAARRNPVLKRRLVQAFKLLVGDAHISIHDHQECTRNHYDHSQDEEIEEEEFEDERDGMRPEDDGEETNSNETH